MNLESHTDTLVPPLSHSLPPPLSLSLSLPFYLSLILSSSLSNSLPLLLSLSLSQTLTLTHPIEGDANHQDVLNEASKMLRRKHHIVSCTLQVEKHDDRMEDCDTCQETNKSKFCWP